MAFTIANWTCVSSSLNQGQETVVPFGGSSTVLNAPNTFMYASPTDSVATITTSGYFDSQYASLSVGDWIEGNGSDGSFQVRVISITSGVVTVSSIGATFSPFAASGNFWISPVNVNVVAHAGGGQTDATLLTAQFNEVGTVTTAADSVKLPVIVPGMQVTVVNNGANAMQVFGSGTSTINDVASATGVSQAPDTVVMYTAMETDLWFSNEGGIGAGVIYNSNVNAAAAIAFSKLEPMTSGNILVGSVADVATEVTMSGDVTIVAAGTTAIGANKVLSSMVSPLLLKYAAVTISAAEFNGMYAAPKVLVAAGGANTLITLHRAELLMTYNSAQYANGGVVAIQYDSTVNGAGIIASTTQAAADFADAASTANAFEGGIVKQPFATCVNKGLYLSNITGAFDTGNSTFVMHLWYSVVPTV